MGLSFKEFLEYEEKPQDYFSALKDELGVNPDDFDKIPQVASFFKLGDTYNLNSYEILGYVYNTDNPNDPNRKPVAARIRLKSDPASKTLRRYKNKGDDYVRTKNDPIDSKIYLVPIDKLRDLMLQGSQQQQTPDMMPPGMGGM